MIGVAVLTCGLQLPGMVCSEVESRLGSLRGQNYRQVVSALGPPTAHGTAHYVYVLSDCRVRIDFDKDDYTMKSYSVGDFEHQDSVELDEVVAAEQSELRGTVASQGQKISELAAAVAELRSLILSAPIGRETPRDLNRRPAVGWRNERDWSRIQDGMSQLQVESILGSPTSVKDVGPYRTLLYRGEVPGSGFVSGNVALTDDRVWMINVPVF